MLRLMSLENLCACVGGVTLDPLEDRATVREGAWGSARPDPSGSQPRLQRPQCLARVFFPGPDGVPGCVEVLVLGLGFASIRAACSGHQEVSDWRPVLGSTGISVRLWSAAPPAGQAAGRGLLA